MSKVYIVIPHYQNWELTHARLWELYKHCREDIEEVIIVDDCSLDDMTRGGLKWWADWEKKQEFRVSSISTEENLGFLKASNFGIFHVCNRVRDNDIIVLLSNDVEIRTNFIRQIGGNLRQFGIEVLCGGVQYSHDTGWNKFGDRIFPYLEGWLLATTSENWKKLGGFDEIYAPNDFEDVDLSTKAFSLGMGIVPLNNPGLHHIGGQSIGYTKERLERTNINKKKFEEKWCKNENSISV